MKPELILGLALVVILQLRISFIHDSCATTFALFTKFISILTAGMPWL